MPALLLPFTRGVRTITDPAHLAPGELTQATGAYYKSGDRHRLHKLGGRKSFGNAFQGLVPIRGLYLAQFESGTDYLLAEADDAIMRSLAGASGGFSALVTGLPTTGQLFGAHMRNRHYLVNGNMKMLCLESDLTTHDAGLSAPSEAPTAQHGFVTPPSPLPRPSVATDEALSGSPAWVNPARVYDVDEDDPTTFASLTISQPGTYSKLTVSGFSPDTTAGRVLQVTWRVAGAQGQTGEGGSGAGGGGGQAGGTPAAPAPKGGYDVTVNIEYSVNGGVTWLPFAVVSKIEAALGKQRFQIPVSVDSSLVQVRMWPEYVSGNSNAVLQYYDTLITNATVAAFSTTAGYRICYTEFDSTRNEESPQSPDSALIELSSENTATYTFPATATNSRATHRRIYRLPDGGAAPHQYGLLATLPISQTSYSDLFEVAVDVQLSQLLRLTSIVDPESGGTVRFPTDTPPPLLTHLNVYSGSLVGVTSDGDLRYSVKGGANSWPEIYVMNDMPFQQNDLPIATATVGNTLIIAASEIMMAREGLPRAEDGTINRSPTRAISGHPGCVGPSALCAYAVDGASRAAWVSRYGVHETDGHTGRLLSKALDWETDFPSDSLGTAVLHFDPRRRLLYLAVDSDGDGVNDRYWTAHMASDMRDEDDLPLWTGPHYGKIRSMASGQVDSVYRLYSGHPADGRVYLEDNQTDDASLAYDGLTATHPLIVTTGRIYDERNRNRMIVMSAVIRHADAGTAQTAEVTWTAGLDDEQATQTVTETISFEGAGSETMMVGLAGDWHQVTITHLGNSPILSPLSLEGVNAEAEAMGRTGTVGVY